MLHTPSALGALGVPNYRLYVSGNAVSLIGLWVHRVATGWLTWELTGSGTWLGIVAFADLFPSIVVGPFAGVLADRADRLRIVRVAQLLSMAQALLLALLSAFDRLDAHGLLALVALNGIVVGVNQPARLALVSSLVPREHLAGAIALNSIVFNLARFIGPALAGVLIVSAGVSAAFAANAASFLAFLAALARIRLPSAARKAPPRHPAPVITELREGIRYALHHPAIGPLLAVFAASGLGARCFVELLPGFADDVFSRGAAGLAACASAVGAGAVAGGLWMALRRPGRPLAASALASAALTAVAVFAFAASTAFSYALGACAAAGAFSAIAGIATQTAVQRAVAAEVRGRVLALYGLIMRAAPASGALLLGAASEALGFRVPLLVTSALALLLALAALRRRGDVERALERALRVGPRGE